MQESKPGLRETGLRVPPIIFGTSCLGNLYEAIDDASKEDIICEWFRWSDGPVVIDTAGKYGAGLALEVIGNGLRKLGVKRDQIIISNKLAWIRTPLKGKEPTFEPGVWADLKYDARQEISYDGIMKCYKQGLDLLGSEYSTDIVSVHDPDEYLEAAGSASERKKRLSDIVEAYRALNELKSLGEVRAVGVGAKNWHVIKELCDLIDMDWVMLACSLTIMSHPPELQSFINSLTEKGIGIINSAVFHGGFLTGGEFFDYRKVDRSNKDDKKLFNWRDKFFALCTEYNISPAEASVAFGMTPPGVLSIALNTSKAKRVRANTELVRTTIPEIFWKRLVAEGLIDASYIFI